MYSIGAVPKRSQATVVVFYNPETGEIAYSHTSHQLEGSEARPEESVIADARRSAERMKLDISTLRMITSNNPLHGHGNYRVDPNTSELKQI